MEALTVVQYVVVEDGDDMLQPNAYMKPNELTVKDIKNSFPHRKRSNYLYRFKVRTEGEGYLWLDLEDNEPVPLCASQTIFMKLNRTTSYRKEQVPQETPPLPNRKRSINLV